MKKSILIFGLILGLVLSINMLVLVSLSYANPDMQNGEWIGYATMVVIYSLLFFGVRNYRDRELGGMISFGKAFGAGALIALLASTLYVISWAVYYHFFIPDFMEVYSQHLLSQTPEADRPALAAEMQGFREMYANPVFFILITYSEVLPVGLLVALLSALILKRKPLEDG